MNIIFDFLKQRRGRKNGLKLRRSVTGEWSVKKGYRTLYIGTKEKCELFMNQGEIG